MRESLRRTASAARTRSIQLFSNGSKLFAIPETARPLTDLSDFLGFPELLEALECSRVRFRR
jgi:hypothetical protein